MNHRRAPRYGRCCWGQKESRVARAAGNLQYELGAGHFLELVTLVEWGHERAGSAE